MNKLETPNPFHRIHRRELMAWMWLLAAMATASKATQTPMVSTEYLRASVLVPPAFMVEEYELAPRCGGVMSDAQLADLIAYLLSLK